MRYRIVATRPNGRANSEHVETPEAVVNAVAAHLLVALQHGIPLSIRCEQLRGSTIEIEVKK